mgnify:CR=1 FL=1
MPQQVTNIKKRIASIKGAYKITSAMKLVSTVKLKKWRKMMIDNKAYADEIKEMTGRVFACSEEVNSPYFNVNNKTDKKLYIVISSTLGLCGSYNNNVLRLADTNITSNDDMIVLGGKGLTHFANNENILKSGLNLESPISDELFQKELLNLVTSLFLKGSYKEVHLIHTEYVNALVFRAKDSVILPVRKMEASNGYGPIIEPSPQAIVDKLMPIYLRSQVQSMILESEVCEQASRSNAMENATKNAEELLDELNIEFNKARQGAITQEITEIVASSQNL